MARSAHLRGSSEPRWVPMDKDLPVATTAVEVGEGERDAAVNRLHNVFSAGELSNECFSGVLEQESSPLLRTPISNSHADAATAGPAHALLAAAGRATRAASRQMASIQLGSGWQLAADTTIRTGFGTTQVDLTAASWDTDQINLHLETWGSIDVLVPEGVAVQMVGELGDVHLESLSAPVAGGPVLRISTSGPTGVIRIHHPRERTGGRFTRWRRGVGSPRSGRHRDTISDRSSR
jgi:hypothetical protein